MDIIMSVPASGFDRADVDRAFKALPWDATKISLIQSPARGVSKLIHNYGLEHGIDVRFLNLDWHSPQLLHTFRAFDGAVILWNGDNRRSELLLSNMNYLQKPLYIYNKEEENEIFV